MNAFLLLFLGVATFFLLAGALADRLLRRYGSLPQIACLRGALIAVLLFPCGVTTVTILRMQTVSVPLLPAISIMDGGSSLPTSPLPLEKDVSGLNLPPVTSTPKTVSSGTSPLRSRISVSKVALTLWALGTSVMLVYYAFAYLRVANWRRKSKSSSPDIREALGKLAAKLGMKCPDLRRSDAVSSPALIGVWQQTILLPKSDLAPSEEVLLHELGHVRQRDAVWLLAGHAVTALLFFHPLAWWCVRRQEDRAEEICDDWVIEQTRSPQRYASQLVDLAERQITDRHTVTAGIAMASFRSALGRRVERILDVSRSVQTRLGIGWIAVIAAAVGMGVQLSSMVRLVAAESPNSKSKALVLSGHVADTLPLQAPQTETPSGTLMASSGGLTLTASEPKTTKEQFPIKPSDVQLQSMRERIIREIEIVYGGPRKPAQELILETMTLNKGSAFSEEAMARDIRKLYATGLIRNMRMQTEPLPNGVKLIVVIVPNPTIKSVVISGIDGLDEKALLKDTGATVGELYRDQDGYRIARTIEKRLHEAGVENAQVTSDVRTNDEFAQANLTFTVKR